MRGSWLLLVGFLVSCQNDFLPPGLYDYQVERLLSGGDSKVWIQVVNSENCSDSTQILVEFLSFSANDSLRISELTPKIGCRGFDTLLLGNADASSFSGQKLFTDSINFANGSPWIISKITSNSLTTSQRTIQVNYISD